MDKCDCSDWIVAPDNLDEKWSCKALGSLSKNEAHSLLVLNPTTYTEAIIYAKGDCFSFHFEILLDFLLANEHEENYAAAYAFMTILCTKPEVLRLSPAVSERAKSGAKKISERQVSYGADIDIYGSFLNQ